MSWHYSRALVAEYSAGSCSDGEQSVQSKTTNTPAAYYSHDKTTDASSRSQFGMMCARFQDDHGEKLLTWFRGASRARTSAQPEKEKASAAAGRDCGTTWPASFAKFSPPLFLPRTPQCSLLGGLMLYSETWPRWGSMRSNGACWARTMPALPTSEIGSGYLLPTPTATPYGTRNNGKRHNRWPTPTAGDAKGSGSRNTATSKAHAGISLTDAVRGDGGKGRRWPTPTASAGGPGRNPENSRGIWQGNPLASAVALWPTPQSSHGTSGIANSGDVLHLRKQVDGGNMDYRDALRVTRGAIHHKNLPPWREAEHQAHIKANGRRYSGEKHGGAGSLSPDWVEWLMGWPIGHTALEPSATDKCPTVWHWPTGYSSSE